MPALIRQFTKITEVVEAGSTFKVPPYKVGSDQLMFFFNGVLCIHGESYQYVEIGDPGSI